MPRIRSIHPGLFTDESFVALTMPARIFLIGVWTDADDHGVFEWKPVSLKMRLFPADNIDVGALLEELLAVNQVSKREHGGRSYGIVRNFCKWQKPKQPSYRYPFPPEWQEYVSFKEKLCTPQRDNSDIPPPALHQGYPSTAEKLSLMEEGDGVGDGRGRVEGEEKERDNQQHQHNGDGRCVVEPSGDVCAASSPFVVKAFADVLGSKLFEDFWREWKGGGAKEASKQLFLRAIQDGVDPDAIILGMRKQNRCAGVVSAEDWIIGRKWHGQSIVSVEAQELAEELTVIAGYKPGAKPPSWTGAAVRVQEWLNKGWEPSFVVFAARTIIARKPGGPPATIKYFETGIALEIERAQRPLPKVANIR